MTERWENSIFFDAVLFDLDGTLIDTVPMITHCFQEVFARFGGVDLQETDVHALFGPGESVIFARTFGSRWHEVLAAYLECYRRGHQLLTVPPDVRQFVEQLRGQGIKTAIVTNKERDTTTMTLEHFGLVSSFDLVVTAQDIPAPKPAPDGIWKVLRQFNVSRDRAVLVGDTLNDVGAAKAAGIAVIQATWFLSHPPASRSWPTAAVLDDLKRHLGWPMD